MLKSKCNVRRNKIIQRMVWHKCSSPKEGFIHLDRLHGIDASLYSFLKIVSLPVKKIYKINHNHSSLTEMVHWLHKHNFYTSSQTHPTQTASNQTFRNTFNQLLQFVFIFSVFKKRWNVRKWNVLNVTKKCFFISLQKKGNHSKQLNLTNKIHKYRVAPYKTSINVFIQFQYCFVLHNTEICSQGALIRLVCSCTRWQKAIPIFF